MMAVDAESSLVHSVIGTAANVADVTKAHERLHGNETVAFGDAGYIGVEQRAECKRRMEWHVAMKPGQRRASRDTAARRLRERTEHLEARVRARGEHAFRVIKRQFGYVKVRYRGLTKKTAQQHTLFVLANTWIVRHRLLATG
jgi:IS5 family transposase